MTESASFCRFRKMQKARMSRNKHGPIPDDHFENDAGPPPKNPPPLSQALLDHIAVLKKMTKREDN
jgi:hypothetical protein